MSNNICFPGICLIVFSANNEKLTDLSITRKLWNITVAILQKTKNYLPLSSYSPDPGIHDVLHTQFYANIHTRLVKASTAESDKATRLYLLLLNCVFTSNSF